MAEDTKKTGWFQRVFRRGQEDRPGGTPHANDQEPSDQAPSDGVSRDHEPRGQEPRDRAAAGHEAVTHETATRKRIATETGLTPDPARAPDPHAGAGCQGPVAPASLAPASAPGSPPPAPDSARPAPFALSSPEGPKPSWWARLKSGLSRSSSALGQGIADIFTKRKLDQAALDDLEEVLLRADLGVRAAGRIVEAVGAGRYDKEIAPDEVKAILAAEIEKTLAPIARPFAIDPTITPFVVLVVGVNGSGKTTTIAKLALKLTGEGKRVVLAAGDTFRAAAIEQLQVWGDRLGAAVIARAPGADAAGLAFDALTEARAAGADVVLMDTAGRLQNRAELMAELEKIVRVMKKVDPTAPHAVLLVLDATVGQNALSQVEIFGRTAGVTGLVMTKLDGTARGGILVALADRFGLPCHFIGVGETAEDLEPFAAKDFAAAIAGVDREPS